MKDLVIALTFLVCVGAGFVGLMKELSHTQEHVYRIIMNK